MLLGPAPKDSAAAPQVSAAASESSIPPIPPDARIERGLRLVVRHFPLDQSCNRSIRRQVYYHSRACAKLANCAAAQQRFWAAHEYLFDHSDDDVDPTAFASALKLNAKALKACLSRTDEALSRDIKAGIVLDPNGTPVFVVDGKPYMQHLPWKA